MGSTFPRVTHILEAAGLGPDFSGVPRPVLEAARERGKLVHAAIEAHHYGLTPEVPPFAAPYYAAYLKFLADTGHEPIISEFEIEHPTWRFCGHPDRVGWLVRQRALHDWKCTDALVLKPVARQLAGYRLAWNAAHPQEPVTLCVAVQFKSDGTYRVHELDLDAADDTGFSPEHQFLASVVVYHARERIAA